MILRRVAERTLLNVSALLADRAPANGTLILAYHGVRPADEPERGERSLHVGWDRFLAHLDVLERCAQVVSLERALSFAPREQTVRKQVVITFDDAYEGAVQLALPELARRGWPSTVFVPTDFLGTRGFWWDQAAEMTGGALSSDIRDRAVDACAGDALLVAKEIPLASVESLPWYMACARQEALVEAGRCGLVTLAPHTASHVNVAAISEERLLDEVRRSLAWCQQFESGRPLLAYPYGRWSPSLASLLQSAGISHALRVNGGWLTPHVSLSPMAIPRMNVPAGLSAERLELGLRGYGMRA